MALKYLNTSNNSEVIVIDKRSIQNPLTGQVDNDINAANINSIVLCNKHATDSVTIDLWVRNYVDNGAGGFTETNFYILNNVLVPNGTTLVLDKSYGINFNNSYKRLYVQLSASDSAVDVIIN
tara:strand:- start:12894 stop:13262 length:369 start_codon:yes stop_codon:yes gene_type:complete